MDGYQMSGRGRKAWNACYDLLGSHELSAEAQLIKIELSNVLEQSMPDESPLERALMLVLIADTNMRGLLAENER
jgi:hypothetical protein